MSKRFDPEQWLARSRKSWGLLAQAAVWVLGILGGFLLPPPAGVDAGDGQSLLRLAQFVATIVIGLILIAGHRWRLRRHAGRWATLSGLLLLLGLFSILGYQHLAGTWTASYLDDRVVVGAEFTEQGARHAAAHPELSTSDLVFEFAGNTENIWTAESIRQRRLILAVLYLGNVPLFTVCLMAMVQALFCLQPRQKGS
ncbi:MAG TPA: hypothetical protein VMS21_14805 [Methylomirabilota bacterium]|nr:hypothetical protein [Methylomirabilota bacterium]